jgi:hypothetical protein
MVGARCDLKRTVAGPCAELRPDRARGSVQYQDLKPNVTGLSISLEDACRFSVLLNRSCVGVSFVASEGVTSEAACAGERGGNRI